MSLKKFKNENAPLKGLLYVYAILAAMLFVDESFYRSLPVLQNFVQEFNFIPSVSNLLEYSSFPYTSLAFILVALCILPLFTLVFVLVGFERFRVVAHSNSIWPIVLFMLCCFCLCVVWLLFGFYDFGGRISRRILKNEFGFFMVAVTSYMTILYAGFVYAILLLIDKLKAK